MSDRNSVNPIHNVRRAMPLLCAVALLLSGLLLLHSLTQSRVPGCSAESGCGSLLTGEWAYTFGTVPVSALAVATYAILLICLLAIRSGKEGIRQKLSRFIIILSGAILAAAVWFTGLQLIYLHSVCPYCICLHSLGAVISVILLFSIRTDRKFRYLSAGIGLCAAMVLGQIFVRPDSADIQGIADRELPRFTSSTMPSVGPDTAAFQVELLLGYKCTHCRTIHAMLPELVNMFEGKVAFVTIPCPLSNACNCHIPQGPDAFAGSCTLAKLALAVWLTDSGVFTAFDEWLFSADEGEWHPRSESEAIAKAQQLVGADELSAAMSDWKIEEMLTDVFELFGNSSAPGGSGIPRFIYGQRWAIPATDSPESLYKLISGLIGRQ